MKQRKKQKRNKQAYQLRAVGEKGNIWISYSGMKVAFVIRAGSLRDKCNHGQQRFEYDVLQSADLGVPQEFGTHHPRFEAVLKSHGVMLRRLALEHDLQVFLATQEKDEKLIE
jgi:hypothetical protein